MQKNTKLTSELMTEDELVAYQRIPEIGKSKDYNNVIEKLKRMYELRRHRFQ